MDPKGKGSRLIEYYMLEIKYLLCMDRFTHLHYSNKDFKFC